MTVKRSVRGSMLVSLAVVSAMVAAGCGGGDGPNTTPTHSAPSTSTTAPPSVSAPDPSAGAAASPDTTTSPGGRGGEEAWTTGPVTVERHNAGVSRLIRIRSAPHPDEGYDRIVFDIDGELPGYTISYVDEVWQDGSGDLVEVPGRRYLLVTFFPAVSHSDDGQPLFSPRSRVLDYPMMRGYVLASDFEGYVVVAVGLDDVVGFRVGELPGEPGRIYIDVAA